MENIDILLRELNKAVENKQKIILSSVTKHCNSYVEIYPTKIAYDGWIKIKDDKGNKFMIDADKFKIVIDTTVNVLQVTLRGDHEYYGICF